MMVICGVKFDTKYEQIGQNSSQEPSTSSKYDCVFKNDGWTMNEWTEGQQNVKIELTCITLHNSKFVSPDKYKYKYGQS